MLKILKILVLYIFLTKFENMFEIQNYIMN